MNLSKLLILLMFLLILAGITSAKPPVADARVSYSPTPLPVQKFVYISLGNPVYFDGSRSFDPDGSVIKYFWDLGDESTDTGASVSHIYASSGIYEAKLMVVDNDNNHSLVSSDVKVVVHSNLKARIKSPRNGSEFAYIPGEIISFSSESINGTPCYNKPHYSYRWTSNITGVIGNTGKFSIDAMFLPLGKHRIVLEITDCLGYNASDFIDIIVSKKLRAEILNLYDEKTTYWYKILYSNGDWNPKRKFSGGGSSVLTLSNFTRVILEEVCFDDNGYIEINGNKIYEENGSCCSPSCSNPRMDITEYVHPGDNTIYGYADDCCGKYGYVSAYISVDYTPPQECYTLREFSNGSKEKMLRISGGGSNSDAKVKILRNISIGCDARFDLDSEILSNLKLDVGSDNITEWNELTSGKKRISNANTDPRLADTLTNLSRDCNCLGCRISGDYCIIDLKFYSSKDVRLTVANPYIQYCLTETCPSCQIDFKGRVSGGYPSYNVKWISLEDGVIDNYRITNEGDEYQLVSTPPLLPPLTSGNFHTIRFEVEDSAGLKEYNTANEIYVRPCCAVDTDCTSYWPMREGSIVNTGNEESFSCDIYEVCHPDLQQVVREAISCCKSGCKENFCHGYCTNAYNDALSLSDASERLKKCEGLYTIYGFAPEPRYMSDYFWAEICCLGDPYCLVECSGEDLGYCRCGYHVYTRNVQALPCTNYVSDSPKGWKTDTAMNKNTCLFSDLSAHMSILGDQGIVTEAQGINTGTSCDYSNSLTTLLRIIGYNSTEVYSNTGPGHCYNLIKFPEDKKYHIIDTVGNCYYGGSPYNPYTTPSCVSGYPYCSYFNCRNDKGTFPCPSNPEVYGC